MHTAQPAGNPQTSEVGMSAELNEKYLAEITNLLLDHMVGCTLTETNGWAAATKGFKTEPLTGELKPLADVLAGHGHTAFRLRGVDPLLDVRCPSSQITILPTELMAKLGGCVAKSRALFLEAFPTAPKLK